MQEHENSADLDVQRQNVRHKREATHEERRKIQARREEIETRRQTLADGASSHAGLIELLDLQHEVVLLQQHIVELQLASDEQQEFFAGLKKRANGLWHDISLLSEESQLRLEHFQTFSEGIQMLREQVRHQQEDFASQQRAKNK
jgi:hypothetical protein